MHKLFLTGLLFLSFLSEAQEKDVIHYKFTVDVNDKNDTLRGLAAVTFIQYSSNPEVSFDLTAPDKTGRGMKVYSVSTGSQTPEVPFTQSGEKLHIKAPFLKKGDTSTFFITYKGIPSDGLIISKNKYGDRTFFADNWPNRAHHWIPCIDRPDDKASFEFIVTAPSHYSVISNGTQVITKEDMIKAEGLSAYGMNLWHYKEAIPQPTKVMVIGVARFATKTYADSPKDIPVSAWVYPQDSTKGFYDYAIAPEIVKFLADYIGPFPYKKLANVQSKTIFGGMENAGAIFYAESSITGKRTSESTVVHEIAHQWFGDMASEKSFAHLWLSEGFASYMTHIYYEKKYGKETFHDRLKADRDEIIAFARQSSSPVVDSTTNLMSLLNANSYQKGSWILHMLRHETGDATFQKIIREYYHHYKGGNADSRDFEAIAEKVSGKELSWFFDQWLYQPGVPVLEMSTRIQDGTFTLYVKQPGKPYRFTLDVDIIINKEGEIVRKQLEVKDKEAVLTVPVQGTSASFSLDPDTKLLYTLKQ